MAINQMTNPLAMLDIALKVAAKQIWTSFREPISGWFSLYRVKARCESWRVSETQSTLQKENYHEIRDQRIVQGYVPGDRGAGGKAVAVEQRRPQLRHPRRVTCVDQEDGHGDDVRQFAAGCGKRLADVAEHLVELGVEVAGERAAVIRRRTGMSCHPDDDLIALGNNGR